VQVQSPTLKIVHTTAVTVALLLLLPLVQLLLITSLPKVIWEEGLIAALSHTYAVVRIGYNGAP